MIEKEQEEISKLKAQISKKQSQGASKTQTGVVGGTLSAAAQANSNWEDKNASSGKKIKFIHVIICSILFLLLGSYLAYTPMPVTQNATTQQSKTTVTETEEKIADKWVIWLFADNKSTNDPLLIYIRQSCL